MIKIRVNNGKKFNKVFEELDYNILIETIHLVWFIEPSHMIIQHFTTSLNSFASKSNLRN